MAANILTTTPAVTFYFIQNSRELTALVNGLIPVLSL